jgi:hypothetical protein
MSESAKSRTCDDVRLMSVKRSKAQAVLTIAFMSTRSSAGLVRTQPAGAVAAGARAGCPAVQQEVGELPVQTPNSDSPHPAPTMSMAYAVRSRHGA